MILNAMKCPFFVQYIPTVLDVGQKDLKRGYFFRFVCQYMDDI